MLKAVPGRLNRSAVEENVDLVLPSFASPLVCCRLLRKVMVVNREETSEQAAVLHFTYNRFEDLKSRRDRCDCAPTEEDAKRCFILPFDRMVRAFWSSPWTPVTTPAVCWFSHSHVPFTSLTFQSLYLFKSWCLNPHLTTAVLVCLPPRLKANLDMAQSPQNSHLCTMRSIFLGVHGIGDLVACD